MIGNMKMCQISGFPFDIGILLESFGFHRREAAIPPVHTGAMKVLMGRDVVTYEISKWMQKLYGCTVQVGTGEKHCLVKDGVEI